MMQLTVGTDEELRKLYGYDLRSLSVSEGKLQQHMRHFGNRLRHFEYSLMPHCKQGF